MMAITDSSDVPQLMTAGNRCPSESQPAALHAQTSGLPQRSEGCLCVQSPALSSPRASFRLPEAYSSIPVHADSSFSEPLLCLGLRTPIFEPAAHALSHRRDIDGEGLISSAILLILLLIGFEFALQVYILPRLDEPLSAPISSATCHLLPH